MLLFCIEEGEAVKGDHAVSNTTRREVRVDCLCSTDDNLEKLEETQMRGG